MSINATKCVTCLEHTLPVGGVCLPCAPGYYCNGAISALCRLPAACLGASCADGSSGLQCETCLSGFFKSATGCTPCSASLASGLVIVPAVFAGLVVVAYFVRRSLKLFASGGKAFVDGREESVVGVSNLATVTLLGDLWQRLVLLHQLNLVSLPPGFLSLLGAAALPFGLDAAGPECVWAWSFEKRWTATVAAVAVLALLGIMHALGETPAHAVSAAAAARTPSAAHANAAAFIARSWLLSGVVQQCAPILLRVCIEAMLSATRASDGATVLWSEPTTLLHAPPHSVIYAVSAVLTTAIFVLAVVPIKQQDPAPAPEQARTWWTWASSLLKLTCAFSVAARVTSESAALALLLLLDLARLMLVWLVRGELESEFASSASVLRLFFASSASLLMLQAAALGCALSSGACAGSAGFGSAFIAFCAIYAALLLCGGGPLLWLAARAAWCPECRRRVPHDSGAPAPVPVLVFQPNPMLLRR